LNFQQQVFNTEALPMGLVYAQYTLQAASNYIACTATPSCFKRQSASRCAQVNDTVHAAFSSNVRHPQFQKTK